MDDYKIIMLSGDDNLMVKLDGTSVVGTDDYNALINIPKINNVEVKGKKTLEDYDIESASEAKKEHAILEKRLDNLILSSGTESSAEVVDARTGYDGTAYDTLGTSIRTQVSELNSDLGDLEDKLFNKSENLLIAEKCTTHGYYTNNGFIARDDMSGCYIEVNQNETYTIGGYAGKNSYTFSASLDSDKNVLATYSSTSNPYVLTTPIGTKYLYVSSANATIHTISVNKGEKIIKFKDGYEILNGENKALIGGDISPQETNFVKSGNNLLNPDAFESGYFYHYANGNKSVDNSYSTTKIYVSEGEKYTLSGCIAHIAFFTGNMKYVDGVLKDNADTQKTFEIPFGVKYATISIHTSKIGVSAILVKGEQAKHYENYFVEIPKLKITKDYSKYKYPYIKDGKVMCNKATDTTTAYYAGVDCGTPINVIQAKWIWENNEKTGVLALISNPNGIDKITNITDLSIHLVLDNKHVKVDILGNKFNRYYYQNIIDSQFDTPMELDGITEHNVTLSVMPDRNRIEVYIDNTMNFGGNFTPDENISSLLECIGRYATFEHYCEVDRDTVAMPMFTYFYCRDINNVTKVYDHFDRDDGQLTMTPQGLPYHLISTSHNIG